MDYKIISVKELLSIDGLVIPEYQRPYKWTIKNVNQLIDDILFFNDKTAYRLGTLVLHKELKDDNTNTLNIVDGQQRTITLLLIALAINDVKEDEIEQLKETYSEDELKGYSPQIDKWKFTNEVTKFNIQNNYREIERRVRDFDKETIMFFFDQCEVVKVVLDDITEAFQFFDSQNARGKDLEPHDLLKAFHLREMSHFSEKEKRDSVQKWESMVSDELSLLFSQYLFRIRNWSKARSARYFTKNDVDVFKGISPDNNQIDPYSKAYRIAHHYIDNYNSDYNRNIDLQTMSYPFQLDQVILNGKRFFEMVAYYKDMIENTKRSYSDDNIIKILDSYEGRNRTGDKYVRNLFDCAFLYFIDKFDKKDISRAIEKLFIWSYSLRLNLHSVQIASVDNHALNGIQVFNVIREAISHKDVINIKLSTVQESKYSANKKIQSIKEKFKELKYYEGE